MTCLGVQSCCFSSKHPARVRANRGRLQDQVARQMDIELEERKKEREIERRSISPRFGQFWHGIDTLEDAQAEKKKDRYI